MDSNHAAKRKAASLDRRKVRACSRPAGNIPAAVRSRPVAESNWVPRRSRVLQCKRDSVRTAQAGMPPRMRRSGATRYVPMPTARSAAGPRPRPAGSAHTPVRRSRLPRKAFSLCQAWNAPCASRDSSPEVTVLAALGKRNGIVSLQLGCDCVRLSRSWRSRGSSGIWARDHLPSGGRRLALSCRHD
jgi:hypothetical protein